MGLVMKFRSKDSSLDKAISNVETTIGELIETMTSIALDGGSSAEEAYVLTALAMQDMLSANQREIFREI